MSENLARPSPPEIPPGCIGCPMVEHRMELAEEASDLANEAIAEVDEYINHNLHLLLELHEVVSHPMYRYALMVRDAINVSEFIRLHPDTAALPLTAFLESYRTDENKLGDEAFRDLKDIIAEDEHVSQEITTAQALELTFHMMERFEGTFTNDPLSKIPVVEQIISNQRVRSDKLYDIRSEISEKAHNQIHKQYTEISELTGDCPDGVQQKEAGLFKKRVIRYCGSRAITQQSGQQT